MRLPWEDPRSKLLSLEELRRNYKASREQFRNEPQQGKRLRGATPLELWQERMARKPLRKLPPEMEYLISTHKREMALTEKGIAISLGRWDKACYYSAELGRWVGHRRERVLVFRNIFDPSRITVSDLKRREFLSVPRQQLPAKSATRAQIAATERHKRGFIEQATGRFGRLTHPLQHTVIRDNEHTDAAKALGEFVNESTARHDAEENSEARKLRQAQRLAADLGVTLPARRASLDQVIESLESQKAAMAANADAPEPSRQVQPAPSDTPPATSGKAGKTYYLKGLDAPRRDYVDYLVDRLTEFRRAGQKSFGQKKFTGPISPVSVRKIAESQLKGSIHDPERFDAVCAYLKAKIDVTQLGKRNHAKGRPNYHDFTTPTAHV